jgi:hypothetical protein
MLEQGLVPDYLHCGGTALLLRTAIFTLFVCGSTLAAPLGDPYSWENLKRLAPGQSIQVIQQKGELLNGKLGSVSEDSITLTREQQTIAVPRSAVLRVRISGKRRTYTLIGAAFGAAVGLALGATGSESVNQSSGGDFANLKPVITVGCGAAGALMGAMIGSLAGNRGTIVYRAK